MGGRRDAEPGLGISAHCPVPPQCTPWLALPVSFHTVSEVTMLQVCNAAHCKSSSGIVLNWPYSTLSTSPHLSNESLVLTFPITAKTCCTRQEGKGSGKQSTGGCSRAGGEMRELPEQLAEK